MWQWIDSMRALTFLHYVEDFRTPHKIFDRFMNPL